MPVGRGRNQVPTAFVEQAADPMFDLQMFFAIAMHRLRSHGTLRCRVFVRFAADLETKFWV
jgi:hypothetical protein